MATEAQILANRLNAQKSTGPRTPEGKAVVAQHAVRGEPVRVSVETQHLASPRYDEHAEPTTLAAEERSCKTKPIPMGANEGQLPNDKGVMENSSQSRLGETKPISSNSGPDDTTDRDRDAFDASAGQRLSYSLGPAEGRQSKVVQLE